MKKIILITAAIISACGMNAQDTKTELSETAKETKKEAQLDLRELKEKQTKVSMSSHSFVDGVHTTFAVEFEGVDAKELELFWKKQLKTMSEDIDTKKQLTAIGTRIPSVHNDTIRVLGAALQYKKSPNSSMHLAFIVDRQDVGNGEGDTEEDRIKACKEFVYSRSVQFKREKITKELEAANKAHSRLEKKYEGLIKAKERAEKSMQKNLDKGKEAEKAKAKAEAELKSLDAQIETKQDEVGANPSEANTAALNEMLGEKEKATSMRDKAEKAIVTADKKVKDLQFNIKKNIEEQATTVQDIEKAKELVEQVNQKLKDLS